MSNLKRPPAVVKKSIDTIWTDNLIKIEGSKGVTSVIPNDNADIVSRLIKALKDRDSLPADLDNPETHTEVEAVNHFATTLYNLSCELTSAAEGMMVGAEVEKAYTDIMDEVEGSRDWHHETAHTQGDF